MLQKKKYEIRPAWQNTKGAVVHQEESHGSGPKPEATTNVEMSSLELRFAELKRERELRERMLNRIPDVVYVVDVRANRLVFVSSEIALLLGHPWQDIHAWADNLFAELMHPEDFALRPFFHARLSSIRDGELLDLQYRMRDARGEWRWMRSRELVLERSEEGEPVRVLGVAEDFTERKRDEDRLREMALVDELTGLRNRRGFVAIAEQYTRIARRQGQKFSLIFIDLDRFKSINDNFGHSEGDCALKAAGEVLQQTLRSSDILCRYGGDEFAVLAIDAAGHGCDVLIDRIRTGIEDWNVASDKPYRIEVSVGLYVFDPSLYDGEASDANLFEEAIRKADQAMYKNKAVRRKDGACRPPVELNSSPDGLEARS
jgi:diguanylate cyclase (GGDEF)-like protein/PAS domain S-box-containing protein